MISNLDQVTVGFEKRVELFHDLYDSFLKYRDKYSKFPLLVLRTYYLLYSVIVA